MYQDNNAKNCYDVLSSPTVFVCTADDVFKWGVDRNITAEGGATSLSQIKKLKEEVQEIEDALLANDAKAAQDGVGDTLVVLLQICRLAGFDIGDCLALAYDEIKDRKGRMINGVFVKETN